MVKKYSKEQKKLRKRILEIIHQARTSHIGSCISMVDIIDAVYSIKRKQDIFVLSNGHAAVALYVVLEKIGILKDPNLNSLYVHPDRNLANGIEVSTGSLGQGLPIAVGMALARRKRNVFCSVSDGECAEGSIWEALRISHELNLSNLSIIINANGWGAYGPLSLPDLLRRLKGFTEKLILVDGHNLKALRNALLKRSQSSPTVIVAKTIVEQLPFLNEQAAHYHIMTEENFVEGMEFFS